MPTYEVVLIIEVTESNKSAIGEEPGMSDSEFIHQELGWAFSSFSGFDVKSITEK